MPVIKGTNAKSLAQSAVVLDMGDLHRQARQIIEQAQREADRLLGEAKTEADGLVATASERGFAQGREEGRAEGREAGHEAGRVEACEEMRARLQQVSASFVDALEGWEESRSEMLLQAKEDVLRFAAALARRVVHRVVELDPTVVQDQVREAIALVSRPTAVAVIVHPEDQPLVEEIMPALRERLGAAAHAELRADERVTRGGCEIVTEGGRIDAGIETQLDRITTTLLPDDAGA